MVQHMLHRRSTKGTSLIELLVVIVIFAVGILAVLQIFPRGLQIIGLTRSETMLRALVKDEAERIASHPELLPDMMIPVTYQVSGSNVLIISNPYGSVDELGIGQGDPTITNRIDQDGQVLDTANNQLGEWQYLTGLNNVRRVIGEGGKVPAPRQVGNLRGSLKVLQFAPILYNPLFPNLLSVYGNTLVKRYGAPGGPNRDWQVFLEDSEEPGGLIWVYRDPARERRYRLAMTAWVQTGSGVVHRDIIDSEIVVPAGPAGYVSEPLSAHAGLQGGETFLGATWDTINVSRKFLEVANFSTDNDPYEYIVLDNTLGLLLFKPSGYNYTVPRGNGQRAPLVAKTNYDIYDWRIIREDFRIGSSYRGEQRLRLNNLLHRGSLGPDHRLFNGLNIFVTNESGGTENRDFLVMDMETGGIVSKGSLDIGYSNGTLRFIDQDGNAANGLQIVIWEPGATTGRIVNAEGRSVRALYMATGEFGVQMTKAATTYRLLIGNALTAGTCYAGGSYDFYTGLGPIAAGESPVRIYFPPMDAGKKVTIGTIWYNDGTPVLKKMEGQEFIIKNSPADTALNLPYIDLRDVDVNAVSINYSQYGWGVRGVKGASITVRGTFNPTFFKLTANPDVNAENYAKWMQAWHSFKVDAFVQKEAE